MEAPPSLASPEGGRVGGPSLVRDAPSRKGVVEGTADPRLPYLRAGVLGEVDENQAAARGREEVRRPQPRPHVPPQPSGTHGGGDEATHLEQERLEAPEESWPAWGKGWRGATLLRVPPWRTSRARATRPGSNLGGNGKSLGRGPGGPETLLRPSAGSLVLYLPSQGVGQSQLEIGAAGTVLLGGGRERFGAPTE